MPRILLVFTLFIGLFAPVEAQKFGHVNFGNLLSQMPETETSNAQLEALSKEKNAEGQVMLDKLETDYKYLQDNFEDLTPKQVEELKAKLEADQQALARFERQVQLDIEAKRRELLGPIIERAQAAIETIAKEGGYEMVFDSSVFNTLLFTEQGTDLTEQVLARLKQ